MEEDIKILEELKNRKLYFTSSMFQTGWVELDDNEKQAIENLIARNKELEKAYEDSKNEYGELYDRDFTRIIKQRRIVMEKGIEKCKKSRLPEGDDYIFGKEATIEILADNEHNRWANWQKYVHSKCIKNSDGSLTIPKELVEHWEYEINTKYKDLPENIKESDRKEVRQILKLLNKGE